LIGRVIFGFISAGFKLALYPTACVLSSNALLRKAEAQFASAKSALVSAANN
jgi:hypothetical protein